MHNIYGISGSMGNTDCGVVLSLYNPKFERYIPFNIHFASLMFYFLEFSLVRQALAIGIVLQAVSLLDERKYFRYILIILIAMSFHSSAAVFFLLLPISFVKCKINLSLSIMIVALCGICAVFGRILTEIGARLIGYSSYLQTEYANAGNVLHPALFLIILMFCTILSIGTKSTKKESSKSSMKCWQ